MKRIVLIFLFMLSFAVIDTMSVSADTPTPTPTLTPSITPTPSNRDRINLATIVPPPSCGTIFIPCGSMPFRAPEFATVALPSPTIIEVAVEALPSTGTPTWTPSPSQTPVMDTGPVSTLAGGAQQIAQTLSVQGTHIVIVNGTPVGVNELSQQFGQNIAAPFAFVRAIQTSFSGLGVVGAFFNFLFLSVVFGLLVRLSVIVAPVIISVIKLILQVITALKPF